MKNKYSLLLFLILPYFAFSQSTFLKTFGGNGTDDSYGITQAADGGFFLAGRTTSFGNGQLDAYLIKLDSLGNHVWSRVLGLNGNDNFEDVIATADNGVLAVGGYTDGDRDALVARFDSVGNLLWTRLYGGIGPDGFIKASENANGEYVIAGVTESHNPGGAADAIR